MKNLTEVYQDYLIEFKTESVETLVNRLNREVKLKGWTGRKGAYVKALQDSLVDKNVDISSIANENSISLNKYVQLKLITIH